MRNLIGTSYFFAFTHVQSNKCWSLGDKWLLITRHSSELDGGLGEILLLFFFFLFLLLLLLLSSFLIDTHSEGALVHLCMT